MRFPILLVMLALVEDKRMRNFQRLQLVRKDRLLFNIEILIPDIDSDFQRRQVAAILKDPDQAGR